MSDVCPVCGIQAVRIEGEAATRCVNALCPAQVKERIKHFASKGAFDMDGLGDKLVEQLVDKNMISSPADLFQINKDDLSGLDRMGDKSAENILAAIEKSKQIEFNAFLYALGIRHVGEYIAKLLAGKFNSVEHLISAGLDELDKALRKGETSAKKEGENFVVSENVCRFFENIQNRKLVQRLIDSGVSISYSRTDNIQANKELSGKTFVLTGSMKSLTRQESRALIEKAGGRVTGSVSSKTDYVVVGADPGSKLDKAQNLGINILDEQSFKELMSDGTA